MPPGDFNVLKNLRTKTQFLKIECQTEAAVCTGTDSLDP